MNRMLQGVKATIEHLIEGGIVVWVLTGDKLETAQSIGYSCGLIDPATPILVHFKLYQNFFLHFHLILNKFDK